MAEDNVVGWHHQLNGHESEQASGDGEGQGSLACCSPWGCKESDMTKTNFRLERMEEMLAIRGDSELQLVKSSKSVSQTEAQILLDIRGQNRHSQGLLKIYLE